MKYLIIVIGFVIVLRFVLPVRAFFERLISPGYSTCENCHRPWSYVEGHVIYYTQNRGMFAVCEHCWQTEKLGVLKHCYMNVLQTWGSGSECTPDNLLNAIEADYIKTHPKV